MRKRDVFYGNEVYNQPSRFLQELPQESLSAVRLDNQEKNFTLSHARKIQSVSRGGFKLGQRVQHVKFGEGVILNFEGNGTQARVQVQFSQVGIKWLMINYAKLSIIS